MTINVEDESRIALSGVDTCGLARRVIEAALDYEGCPYETEVSLLLTNNKNIRQLNQEYRGIDRATDVLSFPMLTYDSPSDFSCAETEAHGCFHPDTGELLLGDIIISMEKVREQAKKYGHSEEREYAFLIAHSMLHLCGYDHMEPEEAKEMEDRQSAILRSLNILR
ncbi:MAG: rRNA maturation RNase YbeY [Lachnospiraceae bacterium]|jgi:probable rRNA maturation factor|nr:rRNA maturation RNase YbeY [Lachnospiraceae bacterium]